MHTTAIKFYGVYVLILISDVLFASIEAGRLYLLIMFAALKDRVYTFPIRMLCILPYYASRCCHGIVRAFVGAFIIPKFAVYANQERRESEYYAEVLNKVAGYSYAALAPISSETVRQLNQVIIRRTFVRLLQIATVASADAEMLSAYCPPTRLLARYLIYCRANSSLATREDVIANLSSYASSLNLNGHSFSGERLSLWGHIRTFLTTLPNTAVSNKLNEAIASLRRENLDSYYTALVGYSRRHSKNLRTLLFVTIRVVCIDTLALFWFRPETIKRFSDLN